MIFLVANHYQEAMDYAYAHDLGMGEYRFVVAPGVIQGEKPRVVVLGSADRVDEVILDALVNKGAEVEYSPG